MKDFLTFAHPGHFFALVIILLIILFGCGNLMDSCGDTVTKVVQCWKHDKCMHDHEETFDHGTGK